MLFVVSKPVVATFIGRCIFSLSMSVQCKHTIGKSTRVSDYTIV